MDNQTAKADNGKDDYTLVPVSILQAIAKVRMYGVKKYPDGGVDNWKKVEPERYRKAAYRHFLAYIQQPDGVDDESGLPHIYHLVTNLAFLIELEQEKQNKRAPSRWRIDSHGGVFCEACGNYPTDMGDMDAKIIKQFSFCPVCGERMQPEG